MSLPLGNVRRALGADGRNTILQVRPEIVRRRRRFAALIAAAALVAVGLAVFRSPSRGTSEPARGAHSHSGPSPVHLTVRMGTTQLARITAPPQRARRRAQTLLARLPASIARRQGAATVTYSLGISEARHRLTALRSGGVLEVPVTPVASTIRAPVVRQRLHNDCEATALQVLLATVGVKADQLELQSQLPRSGPLDPVGPPGQRVWGDPAKGFVGRADGGGPAGGFGVYQEPIAQLARRHGRELRDLTGSRPAAVYSTLRSGHAVMTWVGLAPGPIASWRAPDGRPITVLFSEHAVVLTGISADGTLTVVNPLHGDLEQWSQAQFELMWARLGRRALAA